MSKTIASWADSSGTVILDLFQTNSGRYGFSTKRTVGDLSNTTLENAIYRAGQIAQGMRSRTVKRVK